MSITPFRNADRRGTSWSPTRIAQEVAALQRLRFFTLRYDGLQNGRLHVTGELSSRQMETGRIQTMVARMEYPVGYPWAVPMVFDEEKRFTPSADGHLFPDHRLCLSFPPREEFSVGSEALGAEVLGAALIWMDKRFIFDRLREWPGDAEEHGWSGPLRRLVAEEANRSGSLSLKVWTTWALQELITPNYRGRCPCCSGRPFLLCHSGLAKHLFGYLFITQHERELRGEGSALEAA